MDFSAIKKINLRQRNPALFFAGIFILSISVQYFVFILSSSLYVNSFKQITHWLTHRATIQTFGGLSEIETEVRNENIFYLFRHKIHSGKTVPDYRYSYLTINMRSHGFMPTALLISLILASPVPFSRKKYACLAGIIIFNAYLFFKLYVFVIDHLYAFWLKSAPVVINFSQSNLFSLVNSIINTNAPTGSAIALALVLWIALTFRANDMDSILNSLISKKNA